MIITYNAMQNNDDWEMNKSTFFKNLMIIFDTHKFFKKNKINDDG